MAVSLKPIRSLVELRRLARKHEQYAALIIRASDSMGGPGNSVRLAFQFLVAVEMMAKNPSTVIKEINRNIADVELMDSNPEM